MTMRTVQSDLVYLRTKAVGLLAWAILALVSGSVLAVGDERPPDIHESVSIVALLAEPEAFEGRKISVVGVMVIEFEGDRLCLTREHADLPSWDNCLQLVFEGLKNVSGRDEPDWRRLAERSLTYVRVDGTFHEKRGYVTPLKLNKVVRVVTIPEGERQWMSGDSGRSE